MAKFNAAVSDTDILINLGLTNNLSLLDKVFYKVIFPKYVIEKELKSPRITSKIKAAGTGVYAADIIIYIESNRMFEIYDRNEETDIAKKKYMKIIVDEKCNYIGRGEAECIAYMQVFPETTNMIISDNTSEHEWFEDIVLCHNDLLYISLKIGVITQTEANKIYDDVNNILTKKSSLTLDNALTRAEQKISKNGWDKILF